jgi:hypothetical protein
LTSWTTVIFSRRTLLAHVLAAISPPTCHPSTYPRQFFGTRHNGTSIPIVPPLRPHQLWGPSTVTNPMEQSPPSETNTHSSRQEIPLPLWNQKVHYRVHRNPPLVPILSQVNPVNFPHYFSKINSNIIIPSVPTSSRGLFPSGFPTKSLYSRLFHACYILRTSHLTWLDHPNNTWWSVQIMKLLIMQPGVGINSRTHNVLEVSYPIGEWDQSPPSCDEFRPTTHSDTHGP